MKGFTPFQGRTAALGQRVDCYRNLNEQRRTGRVRWSIRDRSTGLVLGHADRLALADVAVHVNPTAQAKIADGAARTVHAWATGYLTRHPGDLWRDTAREVTYHPHRSCRFYFRGYGERFVSADMAVFDEHGMWAA